MEQPIEIVFTYSREEYVRAMRRYYHAVLHVKRDIAFGLIGVSVGLYMLQSSYGGWLGWFLVGSGLIFLAIVAYALLILPQVIYSSQPKLKNEYRLTFSDAGIEFKTDGIDSKLDWSFYHSWQRDADFYILFHGRRDLSVVPRRVLTAGENDRRFADLLVRKIGSSKSEFTR